MKSLDMKLKLKIHLHETTFTGALKLELVIVGVSSGIGWDVGGNHPPVRIVSKSETLFAHG